MTLWPIAAALPWLVHPLLMVWRGRGSRTLDDEPAEAEAGAGAPLVSVIIPARNEARNIERCARSVLATHYPSVQAVIVDDRSEDGTGDIARALARADSRVCVVDAPPLPDGWFGKQWACTVGAATARADLLCFADADTVHGPDLLPRSINAMWGRNADLFSVIGRQELGSFWERVVQPQIFSMLLTRYGSAERVNRSRRVSDKIANGQCVFVRREAYEAVGGHSAVRDKVAEDLALAQRFFAAGKRVELALGLPQLSTRMYTSLRELVEGWMKNVYAGALDALPEGRGPRLVLPLLLLLPPLMMLAPPVTLLAAVFGFVSTAVTLWAALSTAAMLVWWGAVYRGFLKLSPAYALTFPLGAAVLLYIMTRAIARGRRVRWKGREYQAR